MSSLFGNLYFKLPNSQRLERIWKIAQIDFIHRYYDSNLGLIWALINPVIKMVVYYYVFTVLIDVKFDNFAFYLFTGLIIWIYFQESTSKCLNILRTKRYLLDTIQFYKIDLFYSACLSIFLGFLFNFGVYLILAAIFDIPFSLNFLWIFIIFINLYLLTVGVGILLATINIFFKDVKHFWAVATFTLFWTCPIFFRGESIIENLPFIMYVNPVSGLMVNARNACLLDLPPDYFWLLYNFASSVLILLISLALFNKYSDKVVEYN